MEEKIVTVDRQKLLTQLSLKNGLIIAAVSVVLSLVLYFINPLMAYTSLWLGLVLFVLFIALLVYAGKTIRTDAGGFWTFGEAFKSFLIMGLIIASLSTLYNVLLMTVIDPELPVKAGAAIDENTRSMMEKFGSTSEQIDEAMAKAGNNADKLKITPKNVVTSFGVSLAVYGVLALILAAILKKTNQNAPRIQDGFETTE
ncbi:DUF4199 domain-containing protein [Pedobacter metabolipauper]|uniref:Uncharacterized protein DUF4199 n=1 Tax=Pedobacter metabolipauper TaxID=425513 RepID=A0A4R6SU07_9SPHI|nr:DUF4199 domain-containing protein [Pedobacter metabolipauper]TDQ08498.1 uncharacterized protein DUF4199 [Pedobacter metabolipauper]